MKITDIPALQHLEDAQIDNLLDACSEQLLAANDELIVRGNEGGRLYFLLEGRLEVYLQDGATRVTLNHLEAPAVLGELELLTGRRRSANVRASEPSRLLSMSHERILARIEDDDPAVLKALFGISRVVASRLVALNDKVLELEGRSPAAKSFELAEFRQKLFSDWS